jgi:uncharacterized protein (DUF983 family)
MAKAKSKTAPTVPQKDPRRHPAARGYKECPRCGNTNLSQRTFETRCRRCGWVAPKAA